VKNLPAGTHIKEIRELFSVHGELGRLVLPPSGITGKEQV
jgi:multiple RNA-binding domain-containing protein 1